MKCWHYLQFVTGDEGSFIQNHCYKLSANSSYCIVWSVPLPHTICSLNLKSCDPLQFHFCFQLLDLFIFLSSHLKLQRVWLYTFKTFFFCFYILFSFYAFFALVSKMFRYFIWTSLFPSSVSLILTYSHLVVYFCTTCLALQFPGLSFFK